jgi:hypothetical protein
VNDLVEFLRAWLGRRASGGHLSGGQRGRARADLVPALLSPGRHTTKRPDPLTEVRFWMQVMADSERTIICSPENESRIKSWIADRSCGGILTVRVERYVPDDQIFVLDHNTFDAEQQQWLARPIEWRWNA